MAGELLPEQGANRLFFGDRRETTAKPEIKDIVLPDDFPMSRVVVPGENGEPGVAFWVRRQASNEASLDSDVRVEPDVEVQREDGNGAF